MDWRAHPLERMGRPQGLARATAMSFVGRMFGGGSKGGSTSTASTARAIAAPAPPLLSDPDVVAAGDAARIASGERQGRQSTILTGPFGMPIGNAPVARKALLGQ
jgi:hypothetical protein